MAAAARAALGAVAGARLAVDELSGLLRGHVAVGMVSQVASLDIPDLLAGFHWRHPAIEITLAEGGSDQLAEGVRAGTYDLAFIGLGPEPPHGLAIQVVADEPIVAVVSADATPRAAADAVRGKVAASPAPSGSNRDADPRTCARNRPV